jgi:hypothetical protein
MTEQDREIARQEGPDYRSVRLQLQADGAIRLHAYDMVRAAEHSNRRPEADFAVTVPPAEVAKLALVLLAEKFGGRLQAVTEFRDFCKQHEVVNTFDTWA